METEHGGAPGTLWVSETLRVLAAALREFGVTSAVWFKESSPKNLKSRDFLVPRGALRNSFPDGEVPVDLIRKLLSLEGILPLRRCLQTEAGLVIQLDRTDTFRRILRDFPAYVKPAAFSPENVTTALIINCVPLHADTDLDSFQLRHLRAVLIADHLAEVLTLRGEHVRLIPPIRNQEVGDFLKRLGVTWPSVVRSPDIEEKVSRYKCLLKEDLHSVSEESHPSSPSVLFSVHLRSSSQERGVSLEGYDPNIDHFLVSEEDLAQMSRLENAVRDCAAGPCAVLHVVGREEEFHQQKLDVLWRLLEAGAVTQKHVICGPVTVLPPQPPISCSQYFQ
ncbi:DALR anticodon-binding domain-containing protein 3 [Mantella aurantiaca]